VFNGSVRHGEHDSEDDSATIRTATIKYPHSRHVNIYPDR
jgi:hypothetical protein